MVFFRINDVDIRKACKSPKMRLLSKLLVALQPQWAPFVENMQSTQLKVKKLPFSVLAPQEQGRCSSGALAPEEPGSVLLRSPVRVGAPEELGSVLLRSTPGSELLRSQGRCSSGAGARGGSCQERPSPTTRPVALSHRKSTVEDKRTPVLQEIQHSFTYFTLQSIDRRSTVIGNSL